jgi:hypothetical protein
VIWYDEDDEDDDDDAAALAQGALVGWRDEKSCLTAADQSLWQRSANAVAPK